MINTSYSQATTQILQVNNEQVAYRQLGDIKNPPLLYLNHLAATLDNCDPIIMNGLAKHFNVIAIDYLGVGKSSGKARLSIEDMADDVINFAQAYGLQNICLIGFSLGGFVAQQVLLRAPELTSKAILAGTGGAGGVGISNLTKITYLDMLRAFVTFKDPKYYLFFPMIDQGKQAAKDFLKRITRTTDKDDSIKISSFQRQLKAISIWSKREKDDLSNIKIPVWVVNGDNDRMVPTSNSYDLANRLPNAQLTIYPNSGHGGIFQYHEEFVSKAIEFLK